MDVRARIASLKAAQLGEVLAVARRVARDGTPEGSALLEMLDYQLDSGGKRLRALLPLLVAEALGERAETLVPFGAACEVLHNATLVHDDLQDGDRVRRGRDTVWVRYGVAKAVNVGDAMFYWPLLLITEVDAPAQRQKIVLRRFVLETLRVIDGQDRELALKDMPSLTLDDYFAMVEGKTSGLFALPMAGAAEILGADGDTVAGLEEAARHMGVLFQIQDDLLDLYADKGRDERGSDIREGKRSVLAVHCLDAAPAEDARLLREILDRPRVETGDDDVSTALALFERHGSRRFAIEELDRRVAAAVSGPAIASRPPLVELVRGMCELFLDPIRAVIAAP